MNTTTFLVRGVVVVLLSAILGFAQERKDEQSMRKQQEDLLAQRKAERMEIIRILQEEFPDDGFPALKVMTREQKNRHRERIVEQHRQMGWGNLSETLYNRHVHPSKWNALQKTGVIEKGGSKGVSLAFSFKSHTLVSEVIIIGRVRKLVYHPERSSYFHTSIIVLVDEWLRDDFGIKDKYREVVIKYKSGPLVGGSGVMSNLEPPLHIGEKLLLFLSRDGYVGDLVQNAENFHYSKDDFAPNVFVAMGAGRKYLIDDSYITWGQNNRLPLEQIRTDINKIVQILNVPNFYE